MKRHAESMGTQVPEKKAKGAWRPGQNFVQGYQGPSYADLPMEMLLLMMDYVDGLFLVTFFVCRAWNAASLDFYRRRKLRFPTIGPGPHQREPLAAEFFRLVRCDDKVHNVSLMEMECMCEWFYRVTMYAFPLHRFDAMMMMGAIVANNPYAIRWMSFQRLNVDPKFIQRAVRRSADYHTMQEAVGTYMDYNDYIRESRTLSDFLQDGNLVLFDETLCANPELAGTIGISEGDVDRLFRCGIECGDSKILSTDSFMAHIFYRCKDKASRIIDSLKEILRKDDVRMLKKLTQILCEGCTIDPSDFSRDPAEIPTMTWNEFWNTTYIKILRDYIPQGYAVMTRGRPTTARSSARQTVCHTAGILSFVMEKVKEMKARQDPTYQGVEDEDPEMSWMKTRHADMIMEQLPGKMIRMMYLQGCKCIYEHWWLPKMKSSGTHKDEWTFFLLSHDFVKVMFRQAIPEDHWYYSVSHMTIEMCEWIQERQKEYPLFAMKDSKPPGEIDFVTFDLTAMRGGFIPSGHISGGRGREDLSRGLVRSWKDQGLSLPAPDTRVVYMDSTASVPSMFESATVTRTRRYPSDGPFGSW
jgi:hypothetical protein